MWEFAQKICSIFYANVVSLICFYTPAHFWLKRRRGEEYFFCGRRGVGANSFIRSFPPFSGRMIDVPESNRQGPGSFVAASAQICQTATTHKDDVQDQINSTRSTVLVFPFFFFRTFVFRGYRVQVQILGCRMRNFTGNPSAREPRNRKIPLIKWGCREELPSRLLVVGGD